MTDTPSRMFLVLCLLVGVWVAVYWLYEPQGPRITRDERRADPIVIDVGGGGGGGNPAQPPIPEAVPAPVVPVPAPTRTERRVEAPIFDQIIVQPGDTSWQAIAQRVYGDRRLWQAISKANPFVTPDRLYAGKTQLRVPRDPANIQGKLVDVQVPIEPGGSESVPVPGSAEKHAEPEPEKKSESRPTTYVIQRDDTLWKIAKKVLGRGDRWREVFEANRGVIDDPEQLPQGKTIVVPGG